MKEEPKKIIAHILISLIQDWKPRKSIANDKYNTELFNLKLNELLGYINKHYVRKEDVKGLELGRMEQTKEELDADWFYGYGYNQAVSEINAKIDSLIKDKEGTE